MEKQVIEAIKKIAIEFINTNWNVPFEGFDKLFHWILDADSSIDDNTTLDEYIELIRKDNSLMYSGWIIREIALWHNDKFGFLDCKILNIEINGNPTELVKIQFIDEVEFGRYQQKTTRYFDIYEGGYTEYVKRQKTIDVWEEVS